jgi:hypothetical protein
MTDKDQRSRELVLYRKLAHWCAQRFQAAMEVQNIAYDSAPKDSDGMDEKARERAETTWLLAGQFLWLLCGGNPKNLSKAFHDLALALKGKLHGKNKKRDALIIAACAKAIEKRISRRRGRGIRIEDFFPSITEVDNALAIVAGTTPMTKSEDPKNRKRLLRRRMKILG